MSLPVVRLDPPVFKLRKGVTFLAQRQDNGHWYAFRPNGKRQTSRVPGTWAAATSPHGEHLGEYATLDAAIAANPGAEIHTTPENHREVRDAVRAMAGEVTR